MAAAQPDDRAGRVRAAANVVETPARVATGSPPADGQAREATAAPADGELPAGKPDPGRFALDPGRVTESVQADGTVIIALNGEGMEKLSVADVEGQTVVQCGSPIEAGLRDGVPADFRSHARSRSHAATR